MSVLFAGADPHLPGGVLLPPDRADLLRLLQAFPPGTLVCATPSAGPAATELRRCLRSGIRPDVRIIDLGVTPTVVPVVAAVLVAGGFPAGAVVRVTAEVAAACPTVAVVDGVGRLEEPAPSVAQHAMSWLPGVRFGIDPRGGRVRSRWMPSALDGHPAAVTVSAAARDATSLRWRESLERANPGGQVLHVDEPGPGRWAARRWAEVTAVPSSVDDLARWLYPRVPIVGCSWCGREVSADSCPYCGIVPTLQASHDAQVRPSRRVAW